jgi:hypothetical protein
VKNLDWTRLIRALVEDHYQVEDADTGALSHGAFEPLSMKTYNGCTTILELCVCEHGYMLTGVMNVVGQHCHLNQKLNDTIFCDVVAQDQVLMITAVQQPLVQIVCAGKQLSDYSLKSLY